MKKVLFIDRDGTMIKEPLTDFQVDKLSKLEFIPKLIRNLYKLRECSDYELVMVSNQDGLGTESFLEEDFLEVQDKILTTLKGEDIFFDNILIDKSLPKDNKDTRKPKTGMLTKYLYGNYNLGESFVIGDRFIDVELAKNIGCKAIYFNSDKDLNNSGENISLCTDNWDIISDFILNKDRKSSVRRKTKETDIYVELNLDGTGKANIDTGLQFFNHMIGQIPKHSFCDLTIKCKGDLQVDEHHSIEDIAICLGMAFKRALGEKRGINRYGFLLPMDDCLAQIAIDFGGRSWLVWDVEFKREKIGDVPTEMFVHFFKSFSDAAYCNLNIKALGNNEHHKIESIFKAFARSINQSISKNNSYSLPSTKGMI